MAIVSIAIENRITSVDAGVVLVCNNPTDTIQFIWDAEWEGIETKTARFAWDKDYIDVSFTGNTVQVPEIHHTDFVLVGVYGTDISSTPVKIPCRRSILCYGGDFKRMTINDPFYYEFIDRILAAEDSVEAVEQLVADTYLIASESGIQVNVPGNAGTATRLANPCRIGAATFDGSHDITLADMGAAPQEHSHSPDSIGAAAYDHTHTAADIGAAAQDHTHTAAEIGAAAAEHGHDQGDIRGLADTLASKADAGHTHTAAEIGAAAAAHGHEMDDIQGLTDALAAKASSTHSHEAADITGLLPVDKGGTGAGTAAGAVANLGYAQHMVLVSSEEPSVVDGMLWLKPVEE